MVGAEEAPVGSSVEAGAAGDVEPVAGGGRSNFIGAVRLPHDLVQDQADLISGGESASYFTVAELIMVGQRRGRANDFAATQQLFAAAVAGEVSAVGLMRYGGVESVEAGMLGDRGNPRQLGSDDPTDVAFDRQGVTAVGATGSTVHPPRTGHRAGAVTFRPHGRGHRSTVMRLAERHAGLGRPDGVATAAGACQPAVPPRGRYGNQELSPLKRAN